MSDTVIVQQTLNTVTVAAPGPQGPTGPNQVTSSTSTNLTGLLYGNGSTVGTHTLTSSDLPADIAYTDQNQSIQGNRPTNTQSGTSYSLVAGDAGKRIKFTSSSAVTLTVTKSATVSWATDTEIDLEQYGAGQVTVSPDTGVTINSYNAKTKIAGQYAAATLKYEGSNVWSLVGNLA